MSDFGVISKQNETYGFTEFNRSLEQCKLNSRAGIFFKMNKNYVSLSNEILEILNDPTNIIVSLDESRKRVLMRKAEDKDPKSVLVSHRRKGQNYSCIICSPLMRKLEAMFGDEKIIYGHHVGRMADETNGIIFSLEDKFK